MGTGQVSDLVLPLGELGGTGLRGSTAWLFVSGALTTAMGMTVCVQGWSWPLRLFSPQIIKKLIERKQAQIRKVYPGLSCFKEGVRQIPVESVPGIREQGPAWGGGVWLGCGLAFSGMFSRSLLCRRDRLEATGEGEGVSLVEGVGIGGGAEGPRASDLASLVPARN